MPDPGAAGALGRTLPPHPPVAVRGQRGAVVSLPNPSASHLGTKVGAGLVLGVTK